MLTDAASAEPAVSKNAASSRVRRVIVMISIAVTVRNSPRSGVAAIGSGASEASRLPDRSLRIAQRFTILFIRLFLLPTVVICHDHSVSKRCAVGGQEGPLDGYAIGGRLSAAGHRGRVAGLGGVATARRCAA